MACKEMLWMADPTVGWMANQAECLAAGKIVLWVAELIVTWMPQDKKPGKHQETHASLPQLHLGMTSAVPQCHLMLNTRCPF